MNGLTRHLLVCFVFWGLVPFTTTATHADVWDGGTGNFTDMNWDGGMMHPGTISSGNTVNLDGDVVEIGSGVVNSNMLRLRAAGGSFTVSNAELNALAQGNLSGLDFGTTTNGSGAVTASFLNAVVNVTGAGTSGRSFIIRNSSTLSIDGGSVNVAHLDTNQARAMIEIESNATVMMTGNAALTAQVLRIDNVGLGLDLNSGTIVLNNGHAFRSAQAFDGQLNFSGSAGSATVSHTDLSDGNVH